MGDSEVEIEVEVVVAHDKVWMERNLHQFWSERL